MNYYDKTEQETVYVYDAVENRWSVFSTYPPHIRKLLDDATIDHTETDKLGRVILAKGYVDKNQIRLFKPRS
jgi:hypothetical protein